MDQEVLKSRKESELTDVHIETGIHTGLDIRLNNETIRGLSLANIRQVAGLGERDRIQVKSLHFHKVIFSGDVDLSFGDFSGEEVIFTECTFNGLVSFHHSHFHTSRVRFTGSFFTGRRVDFQYAKFEEGKLSFENCVFPTADLIFVNIDCKARADFRGISIGSGKLDFHFARFHSDVIFEKSELGSGKNDFRKVDFGKGKADFRRVIFGDGGTSFEEAEFHGKATFRSSCFGKGDVFFRQTNFGPYDISFENVDFGTGRVSFESSQATSLSFKGCHLEQYLDLRVSQANVIDLSGTFIKDIVDLSPVREKVRVGELRISGMRNLGRIYTDWKQNNVAGMIYSQAGSSFREKARQFRILKEDYRSNGQYMRMKTLPMLNTRGVKSTQILKKRKKKAG